MRIKIYLLLFIIFSSEISAQNGVINSYFANRKLRESISYVNGILDGTCYYFYENGNLKEEKTFSKGRMNGWWISYFDSGLKSQEVYTRDGIRDGLMKIFYDNGALKEVRTYEAGKLVKHVQLDYDSLYVAPLEAYAGNRQKELRRNRDLFLCEVETCPRPAGGMEAVQENLTYPEYAKLYGLEGKVSLIATIGIRGEVKDVKLVKGIGLGCDEAAIEAVKNTKFLPGAEGQTAVEAKVIFNVEFKLDEADKQKLLQPGQQLTQENTALRKILDESLGVQGSSSSESISEDVKEPQAEPIPTGENYSCNVDVCPKPKGGLGAILKNLVIPQTVKRLELKGEVVVEADVDIYGLVRDTYVKSGIGHGADIAAEVAILSTEFEPGMSNGEPVRTKVEIIVPINPDE